MICIKILTQGNAIVILRTMELSNIQNELAQNFLTDIAKIFAYDMIPVVSRPLNETEQKARDAAEWSMLLNVFGLIGVGILKSLPQPEQRLQLPKLPRRNH